VVQSLDPPGIGGRDLKECLLLQLGRDRQQYPLEERIVRDHLEDLGHNRLPKISKALGVSIEEVKAAAENLASLNPRPGLLFGGDPPRFIKPDVVVDYVEGKYVVRVESDYLPRLRISAHYQNMYREGRKNPEIRQYLKKKFDNAEWLIAAIRQRQSTLQKISEQIVEIQSGFLDHGVSHLKPLKMVEVAERVGVHVSTISRAISDKYIQTPRGIFPLKYFFTGGATKSDGSTEARGSVIQRIKDLIKDEDKDNPFSDLFIANKLADDFKINISRRTVTKYREAEGIASSRERRVY
jgi:RNA polymerase sigma-54 factor